MTALLKHYFSFSGRLSRKWFIVAVLWAAVLQVAVFAQLLGSQAMMPEGQSALLTLLNQGVDSETRNSFLLRIKAEQQYFIWDYITWLLTFIVILPAMVRRAQDIGLHWSTTLVFPAAVAVEAGWVLWAYQDILATPVDMLDGTTPILVKMVGGIAVLFLAVLILQKGSSGQNAYGAGPVRRSASPMEEIVAEVEEKDKGEKINEVV